MKEIKQIVADNLTELRKKNKLTQAELAQKLNYSDKAVSKWERGEALPDIEVLSNLCILYHVNLDYLIHDDHTKKEITYANYDKTKAKNHFIITLLSCAIVWAIAISFYIVLSVIFTNYYWVIYIWALPITFIVLIVFNAIWGTRTLTFVFTSFLVWTMILSIYLQFFSYNIWTLWLMGIPSQTAIILWSRLKK